MPCFARTSARDGASVGLPPQFIELGIIYNSMEVTGFQQATYFE